MAVEHLYVHVPLCKAICTFCDFKRDLLCRHDPKKVIADLTRRLRRFVPGQFRTIYLGGGTPNVFDDADLDRFLGALKGLAKRGCEFTIECNPDLVTTEQARIFKRNRVNRISLGVQSTNDKILKILNRTHTIKDCEDAIGLLKRSGFANISIDFMYALPLMKVKDATDAVDFAIGNGVQHVSFYGLDLKPNALLTLQDYRIDPDEEADQLEAIVARFAKSRFSRYEVSNWAIGENYRSRHNLAYWLTKQWAGVGYGAYGLEKRKYYHYAGTIAKPKKITKTLTDQEYYQQVLMMGLRLVDGIDVSAEPYRTAYRVYGHRLKSVELENNILKCKNVNLLNDTLIDLF